jgi:HEAT repeat protein
MPLIRKPVDAAAKVSVNATPTAADVLQHLKTGTTEQRWSAARVAADIDGGVDALTAALVGESDTRVREAMLTTLSRIGSSQSFNAIVSLLRSDDASVRASALDALRSMTDITWFLPSLLSDTDSDIRVLSCELARGLPSATATQMLCDLLDQESNPNVCAAAIDVLAEVGNAQALPHLAQCAARFKDIPFLSFAIQIASDHLLTQSETPHG